MYMGERSYQLFVIRRYAVVLLLSTDVAGQRFDPVVSESKWWVEFDK